MEASSDPNAKEGEGASCVAREEEPFATSAGVGGWLESSPLLPTPGSADLDLAKPFPHAPLLAEALAPSPPPHPPFFVACVVGVDAAAAPAAPKSSSEAGPGGADENRVKPLPTAAGVREASRDASPRSPYPPPSASTPPPREGTERGGRSTSMGAAARETRGAPRGRALRPRAPRRGRPTARG